MSIYLTTIPETSNYRIDYEDGRQLFNVKIDMTEDVVTIHQGRDRYITIPISSIEDLKDVLSDAQSYKMKKDKKDD